MDFAYYFDNVNDMLHFFWSLGGSNEVIITAYGHIITASDLAKLIGSNWINNQASLLLFISLYDRLCHIIKCCISSHPLDCVKCAVFCR